MDEAAVIAIAVAVGAALGVVTLPLRRFAGEAGTRPVLWVLIVACTWPLILVGCLLAAVHWLLNRGR